MAKLSKEQLKEFFSKLEGPEGCNFHYVGDTEEAKNIRWRCAGGRDRRYSVAILAGMAVAPEDAQAFLDEAAEAGGHCDCEMLFNAYRHFLPEEDDE